MNIIADPGSTHMGDYDLCIRHVETAAKYSLWGIKFQLCDIESGNIPIQKKWLHELVKIGESLGIRVFASVWNEEGLTTVSRAKCEAIKFSYSMNQSELIYKSKNLFDTVIVTRNIMNFFRDTRTINLWTVTDSLGAIYPVTSPVIHRKNIYERFDGFSCHSLDVKNEIKAAKKAGCQWFEFHSRLGLANDSDVPDGRFASTYEEVFK